MGYRDWGWLRSAAKSILNIPGTDNVLRHMDFMAFTGFCDSPAFVLRLDRSENVKWVYEHCALLAMIVNKNATAMSNGHWWVTDAADNDILDEYPNLKRLFRNPNPLQTWQEFIVQLDIYRQLYGEVFVHAVVSAGFELRDACALWVLNPNDVHVRTTGKMFMQSKLDEIIVGYTLNVNGKRIPLDNQNVLHIKDTNQNLAFCSIDSRGKSRLSGLENTIKNILIAEEAIYSLNRDRGAMGILSNESKDAIGSMPITPQEKENLQVLNKQTYGITQGKSKVIITDNALKWQQMSFNVDDLKLFEGLEKNIQTLASVFDYPFPLLGIQNRSSLNSTTGKFSSEEKRMLYQDNIIPKANLYAQKFTAWLGLEDTRIICDFSEVEALQTAETEAADTLNKKSSALHTMYQDGAITLQEYRLALGYDEEMNGETLFNDGRQEDTADTDGYQ